MRSPARGEAPDYSNAGAPDSVDSSLLGKGDPLERDILPLVPEHVKQAVTAFLARLRRDGRPVTVTELRLRAGLPLCLVLTTGDALFDGGVRPLLAHPSYGRRTDASIPYCGYTAPRLIVERGDIRRTLSLITDCSYYALESELAGGYITIPGGHRVGLGGETAVWADGSVRMREISALNFRIARAMRGVGEALAPKLAGKNGRLVSTLIVSPPGAGKTTLLRDLCRISGEGLPAAGIYPSQVGIVDERSEIAASYGGIPQHDVGPRADVLDRCPKAKGIMMVMRSMGPGVIATDEIGGDDDVRAVAAAISCGASVLATCHGDDLEQVAKRPYSGWLIDKGYFEKAVVLSRRLGPGTVEYVGDITR